MDAGAASSAPAALQPLPASEEHAASWRRWVVAIRSDPDSGWEEEPPFENLERCFVCRCEFSLFVRPPASSPLPLRRSAVP